MRSRYGGRAQASVGAELARQGERTMVMAENGMRLDVGGHETWAPVGMAVAPAVPAAFTLAGSSRGETLSWIVQPLVVLVKGVILARAGLCADRYGSYRLDGGHAGKLLWVECGPGL
ncbi:hypothetical protein [Streptomyces sp. ISL-94]|uniref:hypothetical protein n=1 Tax=Streptomyces sp. ISL-94 TaxID=2819190 RepID=UPI001BE8D6C8|nr:hypothetical protein [Streptomyces sp. ISL-94]MBT2477750.1 hypothetical protein [Streptomyces sp. ISL-94]